MNRNEKINKIYSLIEEIKNNAIDAYVSEFDPNNGLSVEDWKNGYKGTIHNYKGDIVSYISYSEFKTLYHNLQEGLDNYNDDVLDKVIKYLNKEIKYTSYYDLDRELYSIDELLEEEA